MGFKPWMAWAGLLLGAASLAGCQSTPPNLAANAPPPAGTQTWARGGITPGAMVNPTTGANAPNLAANGQVATNATLAGNMTNGTGWTNNANAGFNAGWNNGAPMRPMNAAVVNNPNMGQNPNGWAQNNNQNNNSQNNNLPNGNVQLASWNENGGQPNQSSAPAPVWPVSNANDNGNSGMNNGPATGYQPNMPPQGNSNYNQSGMAQPANANYNQRGMVQPVNSGNQGNPNQPGTSLYNTTYPSYPQMPFNRGQ